MVNTGLILVQILYTLSGTVSSVYLYHPRVSIFVQHILSRLRTVRLLPYFRLSPVAFAISPVPCNAIHLAHTWSSPAAELAPVCDSRIVVDSDFLHMVHEYKDDAYAQVRRSVLSFYDTDAVYLWRRMQ